MGQSNIVCMGIESTAHTFGCSIISSDAGGKKGKILSDVKSVYRPPAGSGIHPREAALHHTSTASNIVSSALSRARLNMRDLDIIAYSYGPGLGPCLRVGAVVARTLAYYHKKPLVPINHAVGHIELGAWLTGAHDPVVLLVSGGHTLITIFSSRFWKVFGETLDITVGQLIDQFGRAAGFSSPSGPRIEQLAGKGSTYFALPYAVKGNDVSYSGLLSAAKRLLSDGAPLEDLCFSIQEVSFAMLAETCERALAFTQKKELLVTGGVAANIRLQKMLCEVCKRHDSAFHCVPKEFTGDGGAQIALPGILAYGKGIEVEVEKSIVEQSSRLDRVEIAWRS